MKVAVDIDEVLADSIRSYLNYFNKSYGTNIRKKDFVVGKTFWEVLGVPEERIGVVGEHYDKHSQSKDWYLIPGAQNGIRKLERNYELIIISNRMPPRFDVTRKWLKRNFRDAFKEVYFTEEERDGDKKPSKADICERHGVSMLLEDNMEESMECARRGIRVALFDTYLNQKSELPSGIVRVMNWDEALNAVELFEQELHS